MIRIRMVAAAVAATLFPSLALAQASAPMSREQVKEETRAAQKAGELTPAGGGAAPVAKSSTTSHSTMTREQRKQATLEARKKGELAPAGATQKSDVAMQKQKSTKTREQTKAETMEARKKGELVPAGGGSPAPAK